MTVNSDLKELRGRDPHAVLGVQRGVSRQDVARAFRRRAAHGGHPDLGGDDGTFRQLTRARDILLDPGRLTAYNEARQAGRIVHRESHGTRRHESSPSSFRADGPPATHGPARTATRAEPPGPSSSPAPTPMSGLAVIAVMFVLLGPLLWPVAIVAAHLAVRPTKRPGGRGRSGRSAALTLLYVLSILVVPSVLTIAVATII